MLSIFILLILLPHGSPAGERVGLSGNDLDEISLIGGYPNEDLGTDIMVENPEVEGRCNQSINIYKFSDEAQEMELFRLRNMRPVEIPIKSLPLFAAIKLCAESAEMNYLAPDKEDFADVISLNAHTTAFGLLELLAETYCFKMDYIAGIWRFYRININELVTCCYKLKYNTNELVTTNSPSIKPGLSKTSTSGAKPNDLSSDQLVFDKQKNEIMELIQKILDMPTTDLLAKIDIRADTDNMEELLKTNFIPKSHKHMSPVKGNFYFSSDNNELIVTATRQQHSLIATYLKSIDKPQRLIKIQAMIVETNKNPKSDLGINWSEAGKATIQLKGIVNSHNKLSDLAKAYFMPDVATLSVKDMSVALNFLQTNQETTILQDPVVVTSNNREVALKSVTQQPIEVGNSSSTTITSNNSSNTIDYIEIGTLINIYPKILEGGIEGYPKQAVKMDISIVISSQVGTQEINRNTFPIVSSRTYTYSVVVPSGYTLAIGGLSECVHSTTHNKLPFLGDIPGIGCLFRSRSNNKNKRNLLAFITPTIIDSVLNEDIKQLEKTDFVAKFDQLEYTRNKAYNNACM